MTDPYVDHDRTCAEAAEQVRRDREYRALMRRLHTDYRKGWKR